MQIHLLGSGGFHPNEQRHTACYLLPELGLMIDAGTGAFRLRDRVLTPQLDVVLTHAHLDHTVGLTYLLGLERHGRPVEVTLHAEPQVLDTVEQHLFHEALFPVMTEAKPKPLADETTLRSGAKLRKFELDHPGGSVGLRVDHGGRSLAYVSDTRSLSDEAMELIAGVDLLLHEAYFCEQQRELAELTGHCTAKQAGEHAAQVGAKRLVLIHTDPRQEQEEELVAEAAAQGAAEVEIGRDLAVLSV